MGWGVNILWYNILTPLPLNDIKECQLQSRIQLQLCFIISTIYRSLVTQYQCRYFILSLGGWGVKILWNNILTPPPSKKYSRTVFCKWNPVTTKLQDTIHLHITDNTIPWLTCLFMRWGGGSKYYTIMF